MRIRGFLAVALIPGFLAVPAAVAGEPETLAPGKVKLVGNYARRKLKEGKKVKTYFVLDKGKEMKLRAGGPTTFVLLARGARTGKAKFDLSMDDARTAGAEVKLLRKLSRGLYLRIPAGTHLVKVVSSKRVMLRPMKINRDPVRGEHEVTWQGGEDVSLPLQPLVANADPKKEPEPETTAVETTTAPGTTTGTAADQPAEPVPPPVAAPVTAEARAEPKPKLDLRNRPVEVRLRILADRLAAGFQSLPGEGRYERLVVARFTESGEATKDLELGTLVSVQLQTFLKRDHGFILLERDRLVEVLKEIELSMSGLLDPAKAAQVGEMLGAQAMIVGNVAEQGADFVVNARAISVEDAKVLVADSMNVPRAGMVALSDESVVLRSKSGAVFRSLVVPGWGQFYNDEPIKGGIIVGLEAGLVGAAIAVHFLGAADEDEYRSAGFAEKHAGLSAAELGQKAAALRESAEDYYQVRNILIYSAIGVWLYNILDAYIFGVDGEREAGLEVVPMGPAAGLGIDVTF